jgi:hypothetical protein
MLTEDDLAAKVADAFSEQAGRAPAADIDAAGIFWRGRRRRHRQIATRVVSVTAAAGLVAGAIIAGSGPSALRHSAQGPARTSPSPASSARAAHGQLPGNSLLDAQVVPMLTAQAADAGMPSYYIVASDPKLAPLEVRNSATGKVVSTVSPPATCDPKSLRLASAGNNRDFVFACSAPARSTSFYRLQLTSDGAVSTLTPLSVPDPGGWIDDMALSADGSKLAIGLQGPGEIEVVTLATGAVRTWTAPGETPFNVTWSGHGREVGYWGSGGLYVLNVNAAGDSLHSARLVLARTVGSDDVQDAILSPDGTIIASVTYHYEFHAVPLNRNSVVGGVVEISATTGKPLRTLLAQHATDYGPGSEGGYAITSCMLGSIDAAGHHLLVSCNQFGRLDRGRFTPMPGPGTATGALYTSAW